jgi:hypothetical protein
MTINKQTNKERGQVTKWNRLPVTYTVYILQIYDNYKSTTYNNDKLYDRERSIYCFAAGQGGKWLHLIYIYFVGEKKV